ncbi:MULTISPECIES: Csu type fimbrial protein [unclassified Erwinia]|uniref:Csu type fimbrial protein n=1 Tax=unclassified Erwinia TaxID=2622719 RepID=UPI000C360CB5|nr:MULTISPECIES: spore coat protein U domain-containing protein [unclassified Erwinia]PIJ88987.1 hypothetical protein BLD49_00375 [Erwinia sp. OLMDSP33]
MKYINNFLIAACLLLSHPLLAKDKVKGYGLDFATLCNIYWAHTGIINISTFDKSGLDIEDSGEASVEVPLDVYCLGRPDELYNTSAYFNMTVTSVSPPPANNDNSLVLTNTTNHPSSPAQASHYQLKVAACAGMLQHAQPGLCVNTIGTPTSYVLPADGSQKEIMDALLNDDGQQATQQDKAFCSQYPEDCAGEILWTHVGQKYDHPYRLYAHIQVPTQQGIAPGTYQGTYTLALNGRFSGEKIFGIDLIDMTINNVQQPLTFQLKVSSACQVTAPGDITLPEQMFSGQSVSQPATAQVRCTFGTPYTISFTGSHDDSEGILHMMSSSGAAIPYQITNSSGIPWQRGEIFTGDSEQQAINFQATTLANAPDQPAGDYSDTVTMTVNYTEGS